MPQLHNETPSAQNKRLKAELANERATVADLVEAAGNYANNYLLDELDQPNLCLNEAHHAAIVKLFDALKQANGKGL